MAFVELTKEEKPKLAIQVNNSLKYKDAAGNLQDRQKVTALINIVKEAGQVANMDKGAVTLSLNTENGYKNYFVNKTDKDDIALVPMDKTLQADKDNFIYFNKKVDINNPDKYFYNMSKAGYAEEVVESIKVNATDKSAYLGARVTLSNKELLQDMIKIENDSSERHTAIIGKDKLEIISNAELQARRESKQSQEQDKSKEAQTKDTEDKKKAFKPQNKSKSKVKEQDIER